MLKITNIVKVRIKMHCFKSIVSRRVADPDPNPDPDPLVRGMDPDPSIIMQK